MTAMGFDERKYTKRRGLPITGYLDPESRLLKVAVRWTRPQFDAINHRVVRNNSTFAKEARRLMEIGLRMDHIGDA
jgi:hypothetical protein